MEPQRAPRLEQASHTEEGQILQASEVIRLWVSDDCGADAYEQQAEEAENIQSN